VTPNLVYIVLVGVLFAAGVVLLLERSLTRILIGVILLGHGANVLILGGGRAGGTPIVGTGPAEEMSDPLPQAMILTAIVITLAVTAFLLALAYRSRDITGHDEVQDDVEDRRIVVLAERDAMPLTDDQDADSSEAAR
jgi:multicomponent Na+:H+ antiporter subunit C